ncbi:MAG: hypothetical protein CMI36_16445 [Owenweeksia sp.]|nr:hypothetical protein [Micavibrio sp.]MBG00582.1 hypothetical protein [Owenweeksia sp.]|tara:strand:+ start:414 stop:1892 length:1479 start_codon:yes stop_codon:yes gene_type:complete
MIESLSSIIKAQSFIEKASSLKLLRARNLPFIITFLYREYKLNDQISIPHRHLVQKLSDYIEEIEYASDEDIETGLLIPEADEKAKYYIDQWIEAHYLRNIMDDDAKEPIVLLSPHTEKVFQVFELLREKEFVGTESKFRDIFHKLRDLVENANPDKEKRLIELEKRKQALEEEIRKIKIEGFVSTYEDYQIKSRYEEVNRLANELIGDFNEVEDNFKSITRKIYEKQQQQDLTKGRLLAETFDSLYELKKTDQGKSFYAFWNFLLDDAGQEELRQLTKEVYEVMEDREIEVSSKSLRKLKNLLHMAARKVLDKNGTLAEKLSREIVAKDQLESRKFRELMAGIRQLALRHSEKPHDKTIYLELEAEPDISIPMERKLGEKSADKTYTSEFQQGSMLFSELEDIQRIYNPNLIDKQQLLANIRELLQQKSQVSLKEVIESKGIDKGLAELLAYVDLVNRSDKFFINDQLTETISFNKKEGKYLELPQIIFSR